MIRILAVIVLYKINYRISPTYVSLLAAHRNMCSNELLIDIAIYDNSPDSDRSVNNEYDKINISYICDPSNPGVGKAYNTCAKIAEKKGFEWLLLLDQDTQLPKNLFDEFMTSHFQNVTVKMIVPILKLKSGVIFSPCKYWFNRGFPLKDIQPGLHTFATLSPVNSGIFVNVKSFLLCGGYNERIPLDFSDFQFIERFKRKQSYFYVMNIIGYQGFSNDEQDVNKLANRFRYFCIGASNSERKSWLDNVKFFIVVLVRSITLTNRKWTIEFMLIFIRIYLLKRF